MKLQRLLVGSVLALLALWIIVGEQLAGASSDAVVNVRLAAVRAPTDGVVGLRRVPVGTLVSVGEPLGTVTDALVDGSRLADLERERADLLAMAEAKKGQAAADGGDAAAAETPLPARLAALDERISAERLWLTLQRRSDLRSNVNGLLWDQSVTSGETVLAGQEVALLADCDSAVVTLSVSQSIFNTLRPGQPVLFRLDGMGAALPGTVLRLGGAGAATLYRSLAVAPSSEHLERFDVMALVPALRTEPELRCLIGHTGRVFFERRPLDVLRGWFS